MNRKVRIRLCALLANAALGFTTSEGLAQVPTGDMFTAGTGNYGNSSALTGKQATQVQNTTTAQLNVTSDSLLAPNSVDMTPYPSGEFTYGFPQSSNYPFMGVDRGSYGGMLPPTSTSSVNLNVVDCPIRLPNEGNGVYGSLPGGGTVLPMESGGQALDNQYWDGPPGAANGVAGANAAAAANATPNQNLTSDQTLVNLQNFFGGN